MKINKPKTIKEAIEELETFLIVDMPSKVFPTDRKTGQTMFRQDYFDSKKEIKEYLEFHFKTLLKQIKELNNEK